MKSVNVSVAFLSFKICDYNVRQRKDFPKSCHSIVNLVSYINVLKNTFKGKCNENTCCRQKVTKAYNLDIFEYRTIFARRTCDVYDVLDSDRLF